MLKTAQELTQSAARHMVEVLVSAKDVKWQTALADVAEYTSGVHVQTEDAALAGLCVVLGMLAIRYARRRRQDEL